MTKNAGKSAYVGDGSEVEIVSRNAGRHGYYTDSVEIKVVHNTYTDNESLRAPEGCNGLLINDNVMFPIINEFAALTMSSRSQGKNEQHLTIKHSFDDRRS